MKKLLILVAILALSVALVACGGNSNPPSNNGNQGGDHTHNFTEWELTQRPTCTEDGAKVRYCACGEQQSASVISLGHTPAEAAEEDRIEPTYDADGSYKMVVRCSVCSDKISEKSYTIPMLKHIPGEAVTEQVIDATCYAEGSYDTVVYCSDCGAELERTTSLTSKIDHTPADAVEENRVNPTHEQDGSYQMVVYCSVSECHAELSRATYTLDMLVHHPAEAVIENRIEATCYAEGSYDEVVYCLDDDCKHKELSRKTVALPKVAHTPTDSVVENEIKATCTLDGSYDEVVYCNVQNCKIELSRNTKTIEAHGHTEVIDKGVAPTCTKTGFTDGKHCSICSKILVAQKITTALGHDYANNCCKVCDHIIYPSSGLEFTLLSDGNYSVSGLGNCIDKDIVIPANYNEKNVISISESAFRGLASTEKSITSVYIPSSVNSIGSRAFFYSGLQYVYMEEGVTYVGEAAFQSDYGTIKLMIIPSTLSSIGTEAFMCGARCVVINSEKVAKYAKTYDSIGYLLFHAQSVLIKNGIEYGVYVHTVGAYESNITFLGEKYICFCDHQSHSFKFSNVFGLELLKCSDCSCVSDFANIEFNASANESDLVTAKLYKDGADIVLRFSGSGNICEDKADWNNYRTIVTRIIIDQGITAIPEDAFYYYNNLTYVTIPKSVTSIGKKAFAYCDSLGSVVIGDRVTNIGDYAFYGCTSLTDVYYTGSEEDWAAISIGSNNDYLKNATIHYNS